MARSRNRGNLDGRIPDARRRYRTLETGAAPADEQTPLERAQAAQAQRVGPVITGPIGVNSGPGADFDVHGDIIARQSMRVNQGFSGVPTGWTGPGVEVLVDVGIGVVQSYDRTAGAFIPLWIIGNPISFKVAGSPVGEVNGTGFDVSGAYHVAGTQVVGAQIGGWSPVTPSPAVSVSATYSQAEVAAIAAHAAAAEALAADLLTILINHGLVGP